MTNIITNASNFSDYISTGVDPRTGLYSFSVRIANFLSHNTSGSLFSLMLNYSASSTYDMGFGRGWSLALSRFDKVSNTLSLSSGQNFRIEWNFERSEYDIPYRRLKDLKVFYLSNTREIQIVYKDGRQDFIDYDEGTLNRMVSPQGLVIYFDYASSPSGQESTLETIRDGMGRKIDIDWRSDPSKVIITQSVNNTEYQKFEFITGSNGRYIRLVQVNLPDDSKISIEYEFSRINNYDLITKVTHPSGMEESISYLNEGHSLPSHAPIAKAPYATRCVVGVGQNQPDQVINYSYSDNNYLGFGGENDFIPNEDSLFSATTDYVYSSEEVINTTQSVKRYYNKYHLEIQVEYRENGTLYKKEVNTYFADPNTNINLQPANYTYLKKKQITHYENSTEKTYTFEYYYDEYGNQTYSKEANGDVIRRQFYPASGVNGLCPREPNGFVSFLKKETFEPATKSNGEQARTTTMTYKALPRIGGGEYVLIKSQTDRLSTVTYEYFEVESEPLTYGRMKKQTTTINNNNVEVETQYTFSGNTLTTTQTTTTHDNKVLTSASTIAYTHGKVVEEVSAMGITTSMSYDSLDRITSQSTALNTEYSATVSYAYQVGNNVNNITVTDAKGNQIVEHYNNAGQLIKIEQTDDDGILRVSSESQYNAFGQLISQTQKDYLGGPPLTLRTRYQYNSRGEISQITHPDGRVETSNQNPVTLISNVSVSGLMKEVSTFDMAGQLLSKETQNSKGERLAFSQYTYDGYGNMLTTTDTHNHVTRYSYDDADRLISVKRVIDNISIDVTTRYADFSNEALPVETKVNDVSMGQISYDGLYRIIMEKSTSGVISTTYEGANTLPTSQSTAKGDILNFTHNKYLQQITSTSVIGNATLTSIQNYDSITGELITNKNANSTNQYTFSQNGNLTQEQVTLNDGILRSSQYTYSPAGRLLSEHDYFGNSTIYTYDIHGRLNKIMSTSGEVNTISTLNYDSYSRVHQYDTAQGNDSVSVRLTFNDIGLETTRQVYFNNSLAFTLKQDYNTDLQICRRQYIQGSETTTETMQYDGFHRLTDYQCTGINSPRDESGRTYRRQQFSYDVYGNVTQAVSSFSDNTTNTADFYYDDSDHMRLISVSNSHSGYPSNQILNYDVAGNLLSDDEGRNYSYNALGQMESVHCSNNQLLSEYKYDGNGQLVSQTQEDVLLYLYYQGESLANELSEQTHTSYHKLQGAVTGRTLQSGDTYQHQFLLQNAQESTLATWGKVQERGVRTIEHRSYSPYGLG
ncbi:RHS repeat protein [Vibrio mediterranei]|uniref:RHS repeat protein n=1 Tax=Vibrio mediterranei TaxID=689 RepID=UPI00148D8A81|nr:RHS repeat protein [Vibrio mediterranei]